MIAALYVEPGGVYYGVPDVEPWGLPDKDARDYPGPWPVVAHPPCNRWAMPLAKVNETRYGHRVGGDGGCFASALWAARTFGGVLEHPAHSAAWAYHGLTRPERGAWTVGPGRDEWVCQVAQSAYGHRARKRTWLFYSGPEPPELDWAEPPATALTSWLQKTSSDLPRLSKREAKATPLPFRDLLLGLAGSAERLAA